MSERKKASDFPKEILALFDGYVHGFIERRDFLEGAAKVVGGGAAARGGQLNADVSVQQHQERIAGPSRVKHMTVPLQGNDPRVLDQSAQNGVVQTREVGLQVRQQRPT